MSFFKDPRVQTILRNVAIAFLVSCLAILGYDATIISPTFENLPTISYEAPGPDEVTTRHGSTTYKTTNISKLAVASTLAVAGAQTNASTLAVTGAVTSSSTHSIGTFEIDAKATAITVTNGCTLSPTGSYQPIQAAGNIGFGSITAGTAGTLLYIVNTSNTSIVLTDTGTLMLAGNITLGQYDTLTLLADGTNWLMLATANN